MEQIRANLNIFGQPLYIWKYLFKTVLLSYGHVFLYTFETQMVWQLLKFNLYQRFQRKNVSKVSNKGIKENRGYIQSKVFLHGTNPSKFKYIRATSIHLEIFVLNIRADSSRPLHLQKKLFCSPMAMFSCIHLKRRRFDNY